MPQSLPTFDLKQLVESIDPAQRPALVLVLGLMLGLGVLIGRRSRNENRPYRFGSWRRLSLQNSGEALVTRVLRTHFTTPDYHLMNHVTVRMEDGTTQIDHILVSRYGIFVIETKDYAGWVFASDAGRTWTAVHFRRKYQFQNPLRQNYRHVLAVQNLLEFVPRDAIRSLVVFCGSAEFKTEIPNGVLKLNRLVEHIRGFNTEQIALNRVQYAVGRLEFERLALTGATDVEHAESLRHRFAGHSG